MPKNKKPAPFMIFVKERYPALPLHIAINKASKEWELMPQEQKSKYKDKAKENEKHPNRGASQKMTCQGIFISQLDKEKKEVESNEKFIKKYIEDIVHQGKVDENLPDIKFNFISCNYFSTDSEFASYTPAEIGMCLYSLRAGIISRYHSLVNPGFVPFGLAYETKEHSVNTHSLGVPPDVPGERNLGKLYMDILNYIRENNECTGEFPPLYTRQEEIKIVESALNFLKVCYAEDHKDVRIPKFKIYPLHYLFYILKKTTTEMGEVDPPASIHITNAFLDRDVYEYQINIACETHEKLDKSKYCSLSCVTRWAYTFSDHLCKDIALDVEPGHHIPANSDTTSLSLWGEGSSNSSIRKQPKIEKSFSNFESDSAAYSIEDFPALKGDNKKKNKKKDKDDFSTGFDTERNFVRDLKKEDEIKSDPSDAEATDNSPLKLEDIDDFYRKPRSSAGVEFGFSLRGRKPGSSSGISMGRGTNF